MIDVGKKNEEGPEHHGSFTDKNEQRI